MDVGAGELHAQAADVAEELVVGEVDAEATWLQHDSTVATIEIWMKENEVQVNLSGSKVFVTKF